MLPWTPQQQQQQLQPQQHLQPQSHQQSGGEAGPSDAAAQNGNGGGGQAAMSLASCLFFLQSEFRRHERDRNEWELERGEMRARIALLEGERRGSDNVRADLLRRVRMLEFALRGERSKYLATGGGSMIGGKPGKAEDRPASPPPAEVDPSAAAPISALPAHVAAPAGGQHSRPGSAASVYPTNGAAQPLAPPGGPAFGVGALNPALGRDPRGRARSRDYLKQCLQEVNYLASPATLNPLPGSFGGLPRPPRKVLVDPPFQQQQPSPMPQQQPQPPQVPVLTTSDADAEIQPQPSPSAPPPSILQPGAPANEPLPPPPPTSPPRVAGTIRGVNPLMTNGILHDVDGPTSSALTDDASGRLTAIFRPDSSDAWRSQLRDAHERSEQQRTASAKPLDADLGALSLEDPEDEPALAKAGQEGGERRLWRARKTLRSHLDAVRSVAFDRSDLTLATGSDDCTVKIWRLNPSTLGPDSARASALPETEPQITLRGHSGPVTAVAIDGSRAYSASLDQTVQIWSLPPRDRDPYAPYDESTRLHRLEGHTDAVWDVKLIPLPVRDETLLASASADGTVKVWSVGGSDPSWLKHTLRPTGADKVVPVAIGIVPTDLRRLAAGYTDGSVRVFDLETGQQVVTLAAESSAAQVNALVAHPTLPVVVTGHDDGQIRLFDLNSGQCTSTVIAGHPDGGVTSVDLDGAGLSLVSAGHDCSLRFYDLVGQAELGPCVQEVASHRTKAGEGVLGVRYHPALNFVASAGADGCVRLYASERGA